VGLIGNLWVSKLQQYFAKHQKMKGGIEMEPNDRLSKEWYEWCLREKGKKFNPETLRIAVNNHSRVSGYFGKRATNFQKEKKHIKEIFVSADL